MKKSAFVAIGVIVVAAIAAAIYWQAHTPHRGHAPSAAITSSHNNNTTGNGASSNSVISNPKSSQTNKRQTAAARSPAAAYCAKSHNKTNIKKLAEAGGLVQIFQHESALSSVYGCAKTYLNHGGDINAADPRADSKHLTPLLFAIKRNDPKMVHFMLDHGADLKKRGGPNHIKPYGYAVFEALHHQSTNYNQVINILNSALGDGATQ